MRDGPKKALQTQRNHKSCCPGQYVKQKTTDGKLWPVRKERVAANKMSRYCNRLFVTVEELAYHKGFLNTWNGRHKTLDAACGVVFCHVEPCEPALSKSLKPTILDVHQPRLTLPLTIPRLSLLILAAHKPLPPPLHLSQGSVTVGKVDDLFKGRLIRNKVGDEFFPRSLHLRQQKSCSFM